MSSHDAYKTIADLTKVCQGAVEGLGGLFPEAWNKIAKQFVET